MTQRTAWVCLRCRTIPPLNQLVAPEPPMHSLCSSTCERRTFDDSDPNTAPPQAPAGKSYRDDLHAACAQPPLPKPPTLG